MFRAHAVAYARLPSRPIRISFRHKCYPASATVSLLGKSMKAIITLFTLSIMTAHNRTGGRHTNVTTSGIYENLLLYWKMVYRPPRKIYTQYI